MDDLIHWIPGWYRGDDDPEDLFEKINEEMRVSMNKQVEAMKGRCSSDAHLQASLDDEILRITESHQNLTALLLCLWTDHNLVAKGTIGDGNCGVEMLISFGESSGCLGGPGDCAARSDMLKIIATYREDLAEMWKSVAESSFWQKVWAHYLQGRVVMDKWKEMLEPQVEPANTPSPVKPKKSKEVPFTPEKVAGPGKLLADGDGEEAIVEVTATMETNGEPPAKKLKKKPTGKARDPADVITMDHYFPRFLAENGMTSRKWLAVHREKTFLAHLGSIHPSSWLPRVYPFTLAFVFPALQWIVRYLRF